MIDVFFEKQCEAGEQADTNTMFFCAAADFMLTDAPPDQRSLTDVLRCDPYGN